MSTCFSSVLFFNFLDNFPALPLVYCLSYTHSTLFVSCNSYQDAFYNGWKIWFRFWILYPSLMFSSFYWFFLEYFLSISITWFFTTLYHSTIYLSIPHLIQWPQPNTSQLHFIQNMSIWTEKQMKTGLSGLTLGKIELYTFWQLRGLFVSQTWKDQFPCVCYIYY